MSPVNILSIEGLRDLRYLLSGKFRVMYQITVSKGVPLLVLYEPRNFLVSCHRNLLDNLSYVGEERNLCTRLPPDIFRSLTDFQCL